MPFLASKGPMLAMPMASRGQSLRAFNVSIPVKIIWRSCSAPLPAFLINDGNAGALSEKMYGIGKDIPNFLYVHLKYGIGSFMSMPIILGAWGDNLSGVGIRPFDGCILPEELSSSTTMPCSIKSAIILLTVIFVRLEIFAKSILLISRHNGKLKCYYFYATIRIGLGNYR